MSNGDEEKDEQRVRLPAEGKVRRPPVEDEPPSQAPDEEPATLEEYVDFRAETYEGEPLDEQDAQVRKSRLSRLTRLLTSRRELAEDTKEILTAVLDTSDRAKTEMVRMVAREFRNYLDELKLKEDLVDIMTSHSLELQMSMSLKPLDKEEEGQEG